MKVVNLIAAVAKNGVIGADGKLPWKLSADLQRFKELTEFSTVIMGRKTWETLPTRPLKNRDNIILSRDAKYFAPGARVLSSLADAIATATTENVWIIGGAELYAVAWPLVDRLFLTEVNYMPDGDAFFPDVEFGDFELVKCRHWQDADNVTHKFMDFIRVV